MRSILLGQYYRVYPFRQLKKFQKKLIYLSNFWLIKVIFHNF